MGWFGTSYVYLLHLDEPLAPGAHTAQHYIGWSLNGNCLTRRLGHHGTKEGARFMHVAAERGVTWRLARLWRGDKGLERRLKNRKDARRLCPFCSGEVALRRERAEHDLRSLLARSPSVRPYAAGNPETVLDLLFRREMQAWIREHRPERAPGAVHTSKAGCAATILRHVGRADPACRPVIARQLAATSPAAALLLRTSPVQP